MHMATRKSSQKQKAQKAAVSPSVPSGESYVRTTITIPGELGDYWNARVADPRHSGNASSYVRNLVIDERERKKVAA